MTDKSLQLLHLTGPQLRLLERAPIGFEPLPPQCGPTNKTLVALAKRDLIETCIEQYYGGLQGRGGHTWLWRLKP